MFFKVNSASQKDTEVLIQKLEADENHKSIEIKRMKFTARDSVKVMLWSALQIWIIPDLSYLTAGQRGPKDRAEPVQWLPATVFQGSLC